MPWPRSTSSAPLITSPKNQRVMNGTTTATVAVRPPASRDAAGELTYPR